MDQMFSGVFFTVREPWCLPQGLAGPMELVGLPQRATRFSVSRN